MRRFILCRDIDHTGVSGTGVIASGVEFDDGTAVMRWRGETCSTSIWTSIADLLAVHGHDGATRLRWVDDAFPSPGELEEAAAVVDETVTTVPGSAPSDDDPSDRSWMVGVSVLSDNAGVCHQAQHIFTRYAEELGAADIDFSLHRTTVTTLSDGTITRSEAAGGAHG